MKMKDGIDGKGEEIFKALRPLAENIATMSNILCEVKAGTSIGKTMVTLYNLCLCSDGDYEKMVKLSQIPLSGLAALADTSDSELLFALNYLHRERIINFRVASVKVSKPSF